VLNFDLFCEVYGTYLWIIIDWERSYRDVPFIVGI
jgi:hypothetical protein